MLHLVFQHFQQLLQFAVVLRRNVAHHQGEQLQHIPVFYKGFPPGQIVHIADFNFNLAAKGKQVTLALVIGVKLVFHIADVGQVQRIPHVFVVVIYVLDGIVNQRKNPFEGQIERINGTFHPLHQIDGSQTANALFTIGLGKADIDLIVAVQLRILVHLASQDEMCGSVDGQLQLHELLEYLVIIDCLFQIGQFGAQRNRFQPCRESANGTGVIILLNMLSGTGDGNGIQHFKEIKVQHLEEVRSGTLLSRPFAPRIKRLLRIFENIINAAGRIQFFVNRSRITLIGKRQLIFQVVKSIVDRRCRQHEDLRLNTSPNHFVEQFQIAVFFFVLFAGQFAAISEIVGFIDHHKVIVAPV